MIITFFFLDRTMAALGHGGKHNEEEGSIRGETRSAHTCWEKASVIRVILIGLSAYRLFG